MKDQKFPKVDFEIVDVEDGVVEEEEGEDVAEEEVVLQDDTKFLHIKFLAAFAFSCSDPSCKTLKDCISVLCLTFE